MVLFQNINANNCIYTVGRSIFVRAIRVGRDNLFDVLLTRYPLKKKQYNDRWLVVVWIVQAPIILYD